MIDGTSMNQKSSRIPLALQAVFLTSNRGKEVHHPPPDKSASKVFLGNWLFQRRGSIGRKEKKTRLQASTKQCTACTWAHSLNSGSSEETSISAIDQYPAPLDEYRPGDRISHALTSDHSLRSSERNSKPSITNNNVESSVSVSSSIKKTPWLSPQKYLDVLFRARGYSIERFKVLQTAYSNAPTRLQTSSYDPMLLNLVRKGDVATLEKMLQAGISPNPCSVNGESLIHIICRRGDSKVLKLFLDYGASVQVSDFLGRTPLHEACWGKPCFETIELILKADSRLFYMVDGRGAVPLSFVQKDYWGQWIEFLKAKQSHFWPKRNATCNKQAPPPLTLHEPNSRPLPNPIGALSPKQASMLVSGKLTPENVRSASRTYCASSDDDDDDSFASEENDHDDSSCSTDTFDMNEMEDLLRQISQPVVRSRIET